MQKLPSEAISALEQGRTIEAIKIVRERTGLGLKESKELVERHAPGSRVEALHGADEEKTPPSAAWVRAPARWPNPAAFEAARGNG